VLVCAAAAKRCRPLDSQSNNPSSACAYSKTRNEDSSRELDPKSDNKEPCLDEASDCNLIDDRHNRGCPTDAQPLVPLTLITFSKKVVHELNPAHAGVRIQEAKKSGEEGDLCGSGWSRVTGFSC
jgi:hypothetical protein